MWSSQPRRLRFTIWDLTVCLFVCALALGMLLATLLPGKALSYLEISVDGEITSYALDTDRRFTIENDGFSLAVVIEDGKVWVEDADCPDRVCEHTGKISKSGQSIACLPAKIVLTLKSKGGDLDAQAG